MISDIEVAWLAGLYEGEGCLTRQGAHWTLTIAMVDEDVIRRAHSITGVGRLHAPTASAPKLWRWCVSRRADLVPLVLLLLPHLGERRAGRAREFLAWHERGPRLPGELPPVLTSRIHADMLITD